MTGPAPTPRLSRWTCVALVGLVSLAGGCTTTAQEWYHNHFKVGPNYQRPQAPVADQWIDAADPRVKSVPADTSSWWQVFDDGTLDRLVQQAYAQNLTVREAGFRVLAARGRYAIAVGNLMPQEQQYNALYSHRAISGTVANRQFTPQRYFDIWQKGFNLAWELDVWGRLRRDIESRKAEFEFTVEEYDAIIVTLVADVAQSYTSIRLADQQLAYLRANVALQEATLKIVTERFQDGVVSKVDVEQAKLNLARTQALVPPIEAQRRAAGNALCVLLGTPPEDLIPHIGTAAIPVPPLEVCVGIPGELLRRRPDVRAAERLVAAQSARIGIAEAELYPIISITGTIGLQSSAFPDLWTGRSMIGAIGPSLQWNILNYGRLINNVRVQDALFQELATRYQQQVLTANQEAEDAIIQFLKSQEAAAAEQRAVEAAAGSSDLAEVQYKEGTVDFNRVFVLQRQLVDQELSYANAVANVAQSVIQLYRSLGGGWEVRREPHGETATGSPPAPVKDYVVPRPEKKDAEQKAPEPRKAEKGVAG